MTLFNIHTIFGWLVLFLPFRLSKLRLPRIQWFVQSQMLSPSQITAFRCRVPVASQRRKVGDKAPRAEYHNATVCILNPHHPSLTSSPQETIYCLGAASWFRVVTPWGLRTPEHFPSEVPVSEASDTDFSQSEKTLCLQNVCSRDQSYPRTWQEHSLLCDASGQMTTSPCLGFLGLLQWERALKAM